LQLRKTRDEMRGVFKGFERGDRARRERRFSFQAFTRRRMAFSGVFSLK
jgi:hypothetical protein